MLFNIVMGNHGPIHELEPFAPIVNYVRFTLDACGHSVTVVPGVPHKNAVNLLFEYFPDAQGWSSRMRNLRQNHGMRVGVIATELLVSDTIPYANNGIYVRGEDLSDNIRRRIAGFNAVVPEVDFLWSFLQRTADEYRAHCRDSRFFPFGHVDSKTGRNGKAPKDIDIVFFGTMTSHRLSVLQQFANRGLNLAFVGRSPVPAEDLPGHIMPGHVPSYVLASFLDRAKIGLNLTLCSPEESPAGLDPRFASCARIVEMLEHEVSVVSEEIPLDNPYRDYMISRPVEELAETCLHLLRSGEWRELGPRSASRFRSEMAVTRVCAPVIDATLRNMGLT